MPTTSTRRRAVVVGALVLIVGLVASVTLWNVGGSRRSDAIENFARAPIGCDTTLDFAESGTYYLFVETSGRLDEVRGDCAAPSEYDLAAERPAVEVTMIDPDGEQLDLADAPDAVSYSSGGFVGRSTFEVDVQEAADHVIRVQNPDSLSFAVAVGRDPNDGVTLFRALALAAGLICLVVGMALLLAVGRSGQPQVGSWTPAQPGPSPWAGVPPTQPPYRQPPPPPPGQPPSSQPPSNRSPWAGGGAGPSTFAPPTGPPGPALPDSVTPVTPVAPVAPPGGPPSPPADPEPREQRNDDDIWDESRE